MTTDRFRTVALALAPFITTVPELFRAVDAVLATEPVAALSDGVDPQGRLTYTHDTLVGIALKDHDTMYAVRDGKKINAIKALRAVSNSGLKAAKEAVEDQRVMFSFNAGNWTIPQGDPWDALTQDEPPF